MTTLLKSKPTCDRGEGEKGMKWTKTATINASNHLEIGGLDLLELAKEIGTPAYLLDYAQLKQNIEDYRSYFKSELFETEIIYASKALACIGMYQILAKEGLSADVVSGGELYTALKADFPAAKLFFHGNNKTYEEIHLAVQNEIGYFIIDNAYEFEKLKNELENKTIKQKVLLRVNPGIEAHTHEYIQTSKNNSKFGLSIYQTEAEQLISELEQHPNIDFRGIHCHIGSQILEGGSYRKAADFMCRYIRELEDKGHPIAELNLGGGFGIAYLESQSVESVESVVSQLIKAIESSLRAYHIQLEKVMIEPGRSIVGDAGVTLYQIGGIKKTYGGTQYLFVDGGMSDNPRPALYQAEYEAALVKQVEGVEKEKVTIAGKCCETGDILIKDILLPMTQVGDYIAIRGTGAYNYSMASHYNRIPKPPVYLLEAGRFKTLIERESWEDLLVKDQRVW